MRVVCKQFNVSVVAPMAAEGFPHLGYGFAITNSDGDPLLSIAYPSGDEAIEARETIAAVLTKASQTYLKFAT